MSLTIFGLVLLVVGAVLVIAALLVGLGGFGKSLSQAERFISGAAMTLGLGLGAVGIGALLVAFLHWALS